MSVRFPSSRSPSASLPYTPGSPTRLRMSSRIWKAAPRWNPNSIIGSSSAVPREPISAPTRRGSTVVYQHVFFMMRSR